MRSFLKWFLIAAVIVLVFGSIQAFRRYDELGGFVSIEKVSPGQCRTIPAPPGVEDIAIDRVARIAFLSSDDRRASAAGKPVEGGIYALDLDDIEKPPVLLTGPASGTVPGFHPHGISLHVKPDGTRTLMVVNHKNPTESFSPNADDHAVEIYDVIENAGAVSLDHRRSISLPEITSPNDVAAVGPDQFYITNMIGSETSLGATLEALLGLKRANLVYFDGKSARKVVEGLGYANGVNVSLDGQTVYVAETGARRLSAYTRDAATGALTLTIDQFFGTGLDNIDIAPDGAIWIGAHPKIIDFLSHASDPASLSPSQIIRVEPQAGGAARTLYADDGSQFSGVATAVEFEGKIIAGPVFDPKLLVCDWTIREPAPAPAS